MAGWDDVYSSDGVVKSPSKYVVELVPFLIDKGVREVLDVGCGTGRHTLFLAEQGFKVHGIDGSQKALRIARANVNRQCIDYVFGYMNEIPLSMDSMDFVLANHSLEYASLKVIEQSVSEIKRVLRPGSPIFVKFASSESSCAGSLESCGVSHRDFCTRNSLPIHHFSKDELRELFSGCVIERLEHVVRNDDAPIPQSELILFGYKK